MNEYGFKESWLSPIIWKCNKYHKSEPYNQIWQWWGKLHKALTEAMLTKMIEMIKTAMFEIRHIQTIMNFKAEMIVNTLKKLFCKVIPVLDLWNHFVLKVSIGPNILLKAD